MRLSSVFASVMSVLLLMGCTTVQTRATAEATVVKADFETSFQAAMNAAMSAGFTIAAADKTTGLINGTRGANQMFAQHNPAINISVQRRQAGIVIVIGSSIGGQMFDYGVTRETVEDFCAALQKQIQVSSCAPA